MARVTFEGARYPLHEGESVLDALLRGGANHTFSCRRGSCQVCLLRVVEGDPGAQACKGLRTEMREKGYFLPCVARPSGDLTVVRPDLSELFVRALVQQKVMLAPDVARLSLEPATNLTWKAGQYVNVRRALAGGNTLVRSYSISSIFEEDYYLELHVRRVEGGQMSGFLVDELAVGDEIELQGPVGDCFYDTEARDRPLLLIATGTGVAPLIGIARDALRNGHSAPIFLYHGARVREGLYLDAELRALASKHANFHYVPCLTRDRVEGIARGRAPSIAFAEHGYVSGWKVHLCGDPEMVYDARTRAVAAGAARADVHADAFEPSSPFVPNDGKKLANLGADPELWQALREGAGLNEILHDFYDRVFEDPRLAPFFHKVSKRRAIEKQYEFLASIFSGSRAYFGLDPFNAHHWMVISDELFDYREALFDSCLRRYGLAPHLMRRWAAVHELFRRELVKGSPRGLIRDGVEQPVEGYVEETISVATVCDGCTSEMDVGSRGRMHVRTGTLFCGGCSARKVGLTLPPSP
ncbi:MAG: FAD-binding oxidoreductase [Polyangiales bacterium]